MQIREKEWNAEWLETDGLGGFASGTIAGFRTRRYHALLLSALTPPTGRVALVNGLEAGVETPEGSWALSAQRYGPDEPPHQPRGCPFQAWSVGELLRIQQILNSPKETHHENQPLVVGSRHRGDR